YEKGIKNPEKRARKNNTSPKTKESTKKIKGKGGRKKTKNKHTHTKTAIKKKKIFKTPIHTQKPPIKKKNPAIISE
ncbi:hypothetical protein MXE29_09860, partial [Acinetobacter baumannii]